MNPEQLAKGGVAAGISLFGVTLADISAMVTIVAGLAAAFASVAAGIYYFEVWRQKRAERK